MRTIRSRLSNPIRHAALALSLASLSTAGGAAIVAEAVRVGDWFLDSPSSFANVPLNVWGQTQVRIYASNAGKRVLTYSAHCSVVAPDTNSGWVSLYVTVNDAPQRPTTYNTNRFCSSQKGNETATSSAIVRASITIPIKLDAGVNEVRIRARRVGNASRIMLGDSALVIHD